MELLFVVLPIALVIAGGFVAAFVWAAKDDQFEDLETPARRMLHDEPRQSEPPNKPPRN